MREAAKFAIRAAVLVAVSLVGSATVASAAAGAGLWSSDFKAMGDPARCVFYYDENNFCFVFDEGSVELGVKFIATAPLLATGVRIYRVDSGPVTGSMWAADGTLLATGTFGAAAQGWQDVAFDRPVSLELGQTYVASYFAPNADYAYEWYFFSSSELTVGPITALQSVEGDRNGVYCYVGEPCGSVPTNSSRDTNYWVTPLWAYRFDGFFQPVDNTGWNEAKAGRAIPVKFKLGGDFGLEILRSGYPEVTPVACPAASTTTDPIEQTGAAGDSSLVYDAYADQYVYTWKTEKKWAGGCYRFELGLDDDTTHSFNVRFVK